ncbi:hypothetical protein quinque_015652 [Culex quinquefasciatus]|uniref:uncharacterized protein LOC6050067 n=1 Tax=Culex quinquefasciatus TaxID=7176 RepID=UPI0018E31EF3|nr:uncharacterized protein LOC6050067 [Culex quinquefasciatus]
MAASTESTTEQDPSAPFLERDIVSTSEARSLQRVSLESALSSARNLLQSRIGDNGDNAYTLLMRLVARILTETSGDVVDFFEEYCRQVKRGHFVEAECEVRDVKGAEHEHRVECAKRVLGYVRALEERELGPTVTVSSVLQQVPLWAQMGFALPPSTDYFIDRKLETLAAGECVRNVRFWGVIRGLTADYYVLEVERDNLEALKLELELDAEKFQIAKEVISGLIWGTVSDESLVHDWCGAESMAMEMFERILETAIPPNTDEELARTVAVPVMDGLLEEAIDEAQEPEVELSVMGSLDVVSCNATVDSSELSLNQVKFSALKTLLEVKLNVVQYVVSPDLTRDSWVTLPGITLDKIKVSRDLRTYFKGNPEPQEQAYLRAVLARITLDRFNGSPPEDLTPPRLFCNRDVAVFYKATGIPKGDWTVKEVGDKLPRVVWRRSGVWPGSFTYGTEHVYFGWGQEKI